MGSIESYSKYFVGGYVKISKLNLKPGHIVSFNYDENDNRKRLSRLVFILNNRDARKKNIMTHGLNLDNVKISNFLKFLRRILVLDTITIIKRKHELRGPFGEIVEKPFSFYNQQLKQYLGDTTNAYRTYTFSKITNVKIWMLDYGKLFPKLDRNKNLLLTKGERLSDAIRERKLLKELFNINTLKLKDTKYKQIVNQRFGNENTFINSVLEIEESVFDKEDLLS